VDLTNSAWRILADFYIRSGGFEKIYLATLQCCHSGMLAVQQLAV
jgi:hypothetical protein